jgi:hypothetical protein
MLRKRIKDILKIALPVYLHSCSDYFCTFFFYRYSVDVYLTAYRFACMLFLLLIPNVMYFHAFKKLSIISLKTFQDILFYE